jgi:hypothetical protein
MNGVDNRPAVKALRFAKDNKIIWKVAVKLGKRRASKLVQEIYGRKIDATWNNRYGFYNEQEGEVNTMYVILTTVRLEEAKRFIAALFLSIRNDSLRILGVI